MKKFFSKRNQTKKAYTLLELSISILVISILATGALSMSVSRAGKKKMEITNQRIEAVYKALGSYLTANKKLPCPAPVTDKKSVNATYGTASTSYGLCADTGVSGVYKSTSKSNLVYGMIPIKDLGLSNEFAEDGFGNRFSYVVDKNFTATSTFPYSDAATFGVATSNDVITIKEASGSGVIDVTYDAILVIVSHGANKKGGFLPYSASPATSSSDSYELENFPTAFNDSSTPREATFDNVFYSKYGSSDVFDDIVFYKTRNEMVKDFNVLDAVVCTSSSKNGNDVTYNGTVMTWPNTAYGRIVESSVSCPSGFTASVAKPTKKCGAFGIWEEGAVKPCLTVPTGVCSGGDIVVSGSNILHIFSYNDTFVCSGNVSVGVVAVGGGGAGGYSFSGYGAGGGGGGQVVDTGSAAYSLTAGQTVAVSVGQGGLPYAGTGLQGSSSTLSGAISLEAVGGRGGGGSYASSCTDPTSATNSPGGGSGYCNSSHVSGGSGTQSGGGSVVGGLNSGGGGGSTANSGSTPTNSTSDGNLGYGAAGTTVSITGFDYGGGGGGGTNSYYNATATDGGGQGGKIGLPNGVAGTNGLGGGGGGARYGYGSKGGNGVVIIYYEPTS